MKILVIAPTNFFSDRGCHIRIYNEAKYLMKKNHLVRVVAFDKGADVVDMEVKRISKTFSNKKKSAGFFWGRIWADWKLFFLTMREIRNFRPDVIHAHLYDGLAIGYLARGFLFEKMPIIGDIQGDLKKEFESYNSNNFVAKWLFPKFSKVVMNFADYVAISSGNVSSSIEKIYKNKERIFLLEDGVDLDLFGKDNSPKEELIDELEKIEKYKGERKVLIYAGGLDESKGAGELVRYFKNVSKKWMLLVFGKGKNENEYEDFVKKNNLEKRVCFVKNFGYFDLPFFQNMADCGIDPKKNSTEGSGKLVGYMASGLPVVCFENKNSRNFLGENGFFMKDFSDLDGVLFSVEEKNEKMDYDLSVFDMKNKIEKLELILKKIDAKDN